MSDLIDTNTVRKALLNYCTNRQVVTYKDLADQLTIKPPQSIQQLVKLLESCQEDDALLLQPQIASVVVQKAGADYPRAGFFQKLASLGLYDGPDHGSEAKMWHQNELEKVFEYFNSK